VHSQSSANVGMALPTSYTALLVFWMLQSAGLSGLNGTAHGVVANIALPGEMGGDSRFS
jgi:hypothetical protein